MVPSLAPQPWRLWVRKERTEARLGGVERNEADTRGDATMAVEDGYSTGDRGVTSAATRERNAATLHGSNRGLGVRLA